MRVALVVHCYFPEHFYGTEAYTRSVALELIRRGHEVDVVTATFAGEKPQARLVDEYEHDGIRVLRIDRNVIPNRRLRDTYDLPPLRGTYERILRRLQPDLVHVTHLVNHTAALLDVTRAMGIPTFATFTDFYGFCLNNKLQTTDGGLCEGPNATRSNCIECAMASHWMPGRVARLAARPPFRRMIAGQLAVRPNIAGRHRVDIDAIAERPDILRAAYDGYEAAIAPSSLLQESYRRNGFEKPLKLSHFGIDIDRSPKPKRAHGALRVGYIGQLAPHKGVHLLLDAIRPFTDRSIEIAIWGDENQDKPYAARLRQEARGLKVSFNGTFPVSEIGNVLAGLDILAIPSTWHENSPLVLLKALATHTPLIVSDVEGLTEFIAPGLSGYSFPRGDVTALRALFERFLADPSLAARMSETTRYDRTTSNMVDDLLDLWADRFSQDAPA